MEEPISVYAEMTPNPNTMKFVANKTLVPGGQIAEFNESTEANGHSELALALFNFPFVNAVFMAANFVTVAKHDNIEWDYITMELREFIQSWLREGKPALEKVPELEAPTEVSENSEELPKYDPSEYDDAIISLIEEYVQPAVANDGGAIHYRGYNDGTVTVVMRGSCAGCPSSIATLKGGIENLLKSHIPEVKEVVAEAL